jgi:hypothetical protein
MVNNKASQGSKQAIANKHGEFVPLNGRLHRKGSMQNN